MATKVSVEILKASGDVAYYEVSGGKSGKLGSGLQTFQIGVIGSMVCYLMVKRLLPGPIKIRAVDGNLTVDIDKSVKKIRKGGSYTMNNKTSRISVREAIK